MRPQKDKSEYIRLRAEGRSFQYISKTLGIAKDTCSRWEIELAGSIDDLKRERLSELYHSYGMMKEKRIALLGETLKKIDEAIAGLDFSEIPPEKLLDYRLKYMNALKEEYSGLEKPATLGGDTLEPRNIVQALGDLLDRIRAGETSTEQAQKESIVLSNILKAYELVEVKGKVDTLEAILINRE